MNTGIIAYRYARALLLYTRKTGRGAEVYAQVKTVLADASVLHSMTLLPELQAFVSLLASNGRMESAKLALRSFVGMYRKDAGIVSARLVTAVKDEALERRLSDMLLDGTGYNSVEMDSRVDPDLVGGFVFEVDGRQLDASVRTRLDKVRRSLVSGNNRLI